MLDARLSVYKNINSLSDIDVGAEKVLAATRKIREEVMKATLNTSSENRTFVTELLTPQVKNLATVYAAGIISAKSHPPTILMRFLFMLLFVGAFLIGYTMVVKNESDWL